MSLKGYRLPPNEFKKILSLIVNNFIPNHFNGKIDFYIILKFLISIGTYHS